MKTELDKKIEKETTFLFNGIQFGFRLDDYTREFGYLLARFHVITDIEIVSDFMKKKMFFDGELLDCGIPLKCYLGAKKGGLQTRSGTAGEVPAPKSMQR